MSEPHVVSALRAKRAEVSGYIRELESKISRQRANLAHIDATIKIFSPTTDPNAILPKRTYRRSRYFAKGEISRAALDALRNANGQPIKASTIVGDLIAAKGFQPDDSASGIPIFGFTAPFSTKIFSEIIALHASDGGMAAP